jgi:sulfite exporter TauE/SafE
MALAGATATGTAWQGAAYMALFGFGTLPAMFGVAYVHRLFSFSWKSKINGLVRGFVVATGLLLILRGMNLGIPYLSPKITNHDAKCCSAKCH